jgi:oxygen-independent coproporphyrinogen-3 oxidase
VRDWAEYRNRLLEGESPEEGREEPGPDGTALERVWLGLRTAEGLPAATLTGAQRERAESWGRDGLAETDAGALRLTRQGWLLLDRLAVELESADG